MGKYMRKRKTRKGKATGVLDSVTQLGVHTRAKTLALQQSKKSNSPSNGDGDGDGGGGGCYLELRSRKLEKKNKPFEVKRRKHPLKTLDLQNSVKGKREIIQGHSWNSEKKEQVESNTGGENLMEFERTTRESTPCSLIRDPDNIQTPGSSTRPNNASEANGRTPNPARRNIPTTHEMNDFFAGSEKKQQKQFIEKYNFDPVNDKPLPGRYEWVKLDR